jgi:Na+/proline symporter
VTLAATKIANVMLGWGRLQTVIVCTLVAIPFASLSGLWGVMASDMVQFTIAMVGVFAAAYYALQHPQVGGLDGLVEKIDPATLSLLPDFGNGELLMGILIIPLTVQWWAVWYPGAEPGGGSYVAQRMLAAKDERHALAGTLWFNIAHYALRPWPWLIVALSSMLVFPTLGDIQTALPHVSPALLGNDLAFPAMLTLLPHGVLGILLASLFSAYVSTISTHLNWGSSYVVNDFYRRFIRPDADEQHLVRLSRVLTAVLMVLAALISFGLDTASTAFQLLLSIGAGTGLIYLLRWFWWRINAWSEIAAMVSSFAITLGLYVARGRGLELSDTAALLLSVGTTTVVWLAVTFLTPPTDRETLGRFYLKVRPAGPGWTAVRAECGGEPSPDSMTQSIIGSLAGCFAVYGALFGVGYLLYGQLAAAAFCLVLVAGSSVVLWRVMARMLARPLVEG